MSATSRLFPTLALLLLAGCASGGAAPEVKVDLASVTLKLSDMEGQTQDLDAALNGGETVALVFWQTWCKSCKAEAPALVNARAKHGDAIRFVGVVPGRDETVDDDEVRKVASQWGYAFPQVRDRDLAMTNAFGVTGTPTVIVLGKGREVLFNGHRAPEDWKALRGAPVESSPAAEAPPGECEDGVCPLPSEEGSP